MPWDPRDLYLSILLDVQGKTRSAETSRKSEKREDEKEEKVLSCIALLFMDEGEKCKFKLTGNCLPAF